MEPCRACQMYQERLESLREQLYATLDRVAFQHGHPEVLRIAETFDAVLNAYHGHVKSHNNPRSAQRREPRERRL